MADFIFIVVVYAIFWKVFKPCLKEMAKLAVVIFLSCVALVHTIAEWLSRPRWKPKRRDGPPNGSPTVPDETYVQVPLTEQSVIDEQSSIPAIVDTITETEEDSSVRQSVHWTLVRVVGRLVGAHAEPRKIRFDDG